MERIAGIKRSNYPKHYKKMRLRIAQIAAEASQKIDVIPPVDGKKWDRDLLRLEWIKKREDHLNAKDCEHQVTLRSMH
jgi:hypothetical protein